MRTGYHVTAEFGDYYAKRSHRHRLMQALQDTSQGFLTRSFVAIYDHGGFARAEQAQSAVDARLLSSAHITTQLFLQGVADNS